MKSIVQAAVCVLVIDACGGTLGGNPESTEPETEQQPEPGPVVQPALTFSITDAPVEDAQNVYITVESVQIAQTEGEWITIPMETDQEIDLLQLQNGETSLLASIESLPAGTYGQTRLILAEEAPGRLVDSEGAEHALVIPSGSDSGLKIQTAFTKVDGVPLELTIDFDLRKSIKVTGKGNGNGNGNEDKSKYQLKPVLRLADNSKSGSAAGEGQDGSVVCVYADGAARDNDDTCENAISSAKVRNGQFKLAFLEPGTYDLRVFRNEVAVGDVEDVVVAVDADKGTKVKLP
ncbi:DUF4382 domain-containing protein [Oligoflexus tunisiensis]|uniref:DUF4382 domain-containing protein n=1 Tax=Oligoflexus tunisiensis TaxID=708132 RepID=UPI001C4080FB|nr:DUF4382 domain-containing protein [Oligoflexus tunisiensis]